MTSIKLSRPALWAGGILAVLMVCLALLVAFFDWNWVREPVSRRVSALTGRSFAIHGDLEVRLSLRPRIVAHDVVLGNASWSTDPVMAQVKRIDLRIDLLKLIVGRIDLPELTVSQPRVVLEINRSGAANWIFKERAQAGAGPAISVGRLAIDKGSATFRDADRTDVAFTLTTLAADAAAATFGVDLTGKGRYKGLPMTLTARGGPLLALRQAEQPYPIEASGTVGSTHFSVDGMLLDPLRLKGEQLNFRISGSDLALLFPLIGVPLPPTGPYKLAGSLDHAGDLWTFRGFKGTLGQSDLAGDFSVDRGKRPQKLTASLVSRTLVLQDLAGFIGAKVQAQPAIAVRKTFLAAEPFGIDKLMAADVDLKFRGDKVVTANLPLDSMNAHLVISGGKVKLAPLDFGVAGGSLVSMIEMDARQPRMVTRAQIVAKALRLDKMFPKSRLAGGDTGTLGGRATLTGTGNSLAGMLATAEGEAAVIMEGGSVGELALRMSNLDIANSLLVMLGGDKQVAVRCLVGIFNASDGQFKAKTLVMDTAKVNMTGTGHVDFTDESLHLSLTSKSKGFSLASLRGPIAVSGSFLQPVLRPQLQEGIIRGGLAVALGVATGGIGALIPLLDTGGAKDSNCAALIVQAGQETGVKASDMRPAQLQGKPAR
jgi:uncharacterized protein involved in outer membrane biogenesis